MYLITVCFSASVDLGYIVTGTLTDWVTETECLCLLLLEQGADPRSLDPEPASFAMMMAIRTGRLATFR